MLPVLFLCVEISQCGMSWQLVNIDRKKIALSHFCWVSECDLLIHDWPLNRRALWLSLLWGRGVLPPPTGCGQLNHYSLPLLTGLLLQVSTARGFIFLPHLQVSLVLQLMVLCNTCEVMYQPASVKCQQPNMMLYMRTDVGGTGTCTCTRSKRGKIQIQVC